MYTPEDKRLADAAIASSLGDTILPDPEELSLRGFGDTTLLVLAVVAHLHGASAKEIQRATGQWRVAVRLCLRSLRRGGLVERHRRPGPDHWYATTAGTKLGLIPYVTRLIGTTGSNFLGPTGNWYARFPWATSTATSEASPALAGARSFRKFSAIGTEDGPPMFRPSVALADVNDTAALAEVIRTGIHDDRMYALTKLIALKDPASVEVLCELAHRRDEDEPFAREAVVALGSFPTPAAVDTLIDIAACRNSFVREAAARSLGRLHASKAIPTLIELVDYQSAPVRAAAVRALGEIGDHSAASAIAGARSDADRQVRRCARRALRRLDTKNS
jgi:hypothetical protein